MTGGRRRGVDSLSTFATAPVAIDPEIMRRVKEILRRDLKLGPDLPMADDMPLFGGPIDVDSLDLLLVVSSLERELGVKIPSEAVGEATFRSVATLARYVQDHRGTTAPAPAPVPPPVDPLDRLPHRDPFRFVTRAELVVPDDLARAVWTVTGAEPFFAGHFPGRPLVPGVLIAEALAQTAGLVAAGVEGIGKLAHVDVRFERPVVPPADITLHAKLVRKVVNLRQFEVSAVVGEHTVARGTLALQIGGNA
jgi:3-hydroxyacyl-[acyl-carrier-protein] dehydratase